MSFFQVLSTVCNFKQMCKNKPIQECVYPMRGMQFQNLHKPWEIRRNYTPHCCWNDFLYEC